MSEDNIVTIGGEAIVLPPILNFASLKRAWPAIRASGAAVPRRPATAPWPIC